MLKRIDRPYAALAIFAIVFVLSALLVPSHQATNEIGSSYASYDNQQESPLRFFWDWITKDSISFFTFVLAIASLGQGLFLIRADITSREAARAATSIAKKQLELASLQADNMEKSRQIERLKYFAEYRPKMEIRFVRKLPYSEQFPPDEQSTKTEFMIINAGTGDAVVTGSRVKLTWIEAEDIPVPANLGTAEIDKIPHRTFIPGNSDTITVESEQTGGLTDSFIMAGNPDYPQQLYLLGWVVYADARGQELGPSRTTYFARRFDQKRKAFVVADELTDWEWTH